MAESVWWFLIVGLVAGGVITAYVMADFARREEDIEADEREAEASLIASQLATGRRPIDAATVAAVLRAHREVLGLPPPDRVERLAAWPTSGSSAADRDADDQPDEVGHGGGRGADQDLPPA